MAINLINFNNLTVHISLVDKEIAAQKQMLKEADETLNQILTKMEHEVYELDPDFREDSSGKSFKNVLIADLRTCFKNVLSFELSFFLSF